MADWNRNPNQRRGLNGRPRGMNELQYMEWYRRERARRYRAYMQARGGPFREGYNPGPGSHPGPRGPEYPPGQNPPQHDRYRPRPLRYGPTWQGGMREGNYISWENTDGEKPGGWESAENFREYNQRGAPPGFNTGARRSPDEDIRGDIYELLSVNSSIFVPDIDVYVRDGYVRLEGVVGNRKEADRAGAIAHMVSGVRGVDNRLRTRI